MNFTNKKKLFNFFVLNYFIIITLLSLLSILVTLEEVSKQVFEISSISAQIKSDFVILKDRITQLETILSAANLTQIQEKKNISEFVISNLLIFLIGQVTILFLYNTFFHYFYCDNFRLYLTKSMLINTCSNQKIGETFSSDSSDIMQLFLKVVSQMKSFSQTLLEKDLENTYIKFLLHKIENHIMLMNKFTTYEHISLIENLNVIYCVVIGINKKVDILESKKKYLNEIFDVLVNSGVDFSSTIDLVTQIY